jgi:hypothetical protein
VKVVLQNGTEAPFELSLEQEPTSNPWTAGRWFRLVTKLLPGDYRFRFNASDTLDFALGDVDWNANRILIAARNRAPELQGQSFTPLEGDTSTLFTFQVLYRDRDDEEALTATVRIDGTAHTMSTDSVGPWDAWVTFYYETALPVGDDHRFYFEFSDGEDPVRLPLETDSPNWFPGPLVVRPNVAPVLASEAVDPTEGNRSTTFTFTVVYSDADGDAPTTSLLYLDGEPVLMDATTSDHVNGTAFTLSTSLGLGSHQFYFVFNDSKAKVRHPLMGLFEGPIVVNLGPLAGIVTPREGERFAPGDFITFDGSNSSDPDDDAISYHWSSDIDGELGTEMGHDLQLSEGEHVITLTVTDDLGMSSSHSINLVVRPYLPYLRPTEVEVAIKDLVEGDPVSIRVRVWNEGEAVALDEPLKVLIDDVETFDALVTLEVGKDINLYWNWTSTTGTHTVRVSVMDETTPGTDFQVAANTPPDAEPEVTIPENKTRYKVKVAITFAARAMDANNDTLTFEWDFGDGATKETSEDPTHTYTRPGTYTVSLNVTDARGGTTTEYLEVVVFKPKEKDSPGFGPSMVLVAVVAVASMAAFRRRR